MTVFYILWSSIEQRYNLNNHFGTWGDGHQPPHELVESNRPENDENNRNYLVRDSSANNLQPSVNFQRSDETLQRHEHSNHQKRMVHQFIVGKPSLLKVHVTFKENSETKTTFLLN